MKTRFFGILMVVMLVLQSITFTSVFANESATDRLVFDFSDANASYTVTNTIENQFDYEIVKGQYGKAPDDGSIRLYSLGGSASGLEKTKALELSISDTQVSAASSGEFVHLSYQYLNEDGYSALTVRANYYAADNTDQKVYDATIMTQPRVDTVRQSRFFQNAAKKVDNNTNFTGTWSQADIYFDPTNIANTTVFHNGVKLDYSDATGWDNNSEKSDLVGRIYKLSLSQTIAGSSPFESTGIQLDNITIEKVKSVPASQDYRYLGETLDFDHGMTIAADSRDRIGYMIPYINSSKVVINYPRFNPYNGIAATGVVFKSADANTIEYGVFGRPNSNGSLHTQISSDATVQQAMYYNPGVMDLKSGEYAHLSFAMANNAKNRAWVRSQDALFGGKKAAALILFEIEASGNVKMLDQDVGAKCETQKWYKIDLVFKIGNGTDTYTKVDGYIDGVKYLVDYEWKHSDDNYSVLTSVGTLDFANTANADYYVDDVAFGVFNANSLHNPEAGYSLTSASADDVFVDDSQDIVAITEDKVYTSYSDLFVNTADVTVCNSAGTITYAGTLDNESWVKVSNGFGGGVYYNVGYKTDKLAIGDISYANGKITSQAKVGFGIREDYDAPVADVPQAGTIILALYDGTELVGCQTESYTNLSKDIELAAASVTGLKVKAFIFDTMTSLTPLVVNETKTDF